MLASQRRKLKQLQAKSAFMHANAADFPANSPGRIATKGLDDAIALILSLAAQQSPNARMQQIGIKADNLDKLVRLLQKMNRAANALADEIDGIEDLFRLPRRRSEQIWLATARRFHADSAAHDAEFTVYDLPETFRADLLALINAIETADTGADTAEAQAGGATGAMVDAFRQGGKYSRRLDAIVENKYDDNPQKLAEWRIASHLEAAPQKTEDKKEDE